MEFPQQQASIDTRAPVPCVESPPQQVSMALLFSHFLVSDLILAKAGDSSV